MRQIRPLMFIISYDATFLSIPPLESASIIGSHVENREMRWSVASDQWSVVGGPRLVVSGEWRKALDGPAPVFVATRSRQVATWATFTSGRMLEKLRKRPLSATLRAAWRTFKVETVD
jgi:hypothetical protein